MLDKIIKLLCVLLSAQNVYCSFLTGYEWPKLEAPSTLWPTCETDEDCGSGLVCINVMIENPGGAFRIAESGRGC